MKLHELGFILFKNNTKKYFIDLTRDKLNIKINLKKSVLVQLKSINLSTVFW